MDNLHSQTEDSPNYLRRWKLQTEVVLPYAKRAIRKPLAGLFALSRAFKAQLFAICATLFLIFAAPSIASSVSEFFVPPETKKAFGLIKHQSERPFKRVLENGMLGIFWIASVGGSLLLFWLALPKGLALANLRGQLRLEEAQRVADSDPALARRLEALARALITDGELETSTAESGSTVVAKIDGKLVRFSADDIPKQGDSVGVDGRFVLGEELGRGSMGVVYDARDTLLDRRVALKQLPVWLAGNPEFAQRFMREAKALARLNHQNIVQLYDLIEESGRLWMALEYVSGGDLAQKIEQSGAVSLSEALDLATKIACGLSTAHEAGIVHRDLKPANVLLSANGEPKVTDFGIARLSQDASMTQEGAIIGSPRYMSPEQAEGAVADERSDIYALGVTLYELVCGAPLFDGPTGAILAQHLTKIPEIPIHISKNIPPEFESFLLRMLAKSSDERPESMAQVSEALSALRRSTGQTSTV